MANLGYGEEEIDDFLMVVDEDCSGTIEWQEFLPAAGKFIRQDSSAIRPRASSPVDQALSGTSLQQKTYSSLLVETASDIRARMTRACTGRRPRSTIIR